MRNKEMQTVAPPKPVTGRGSHGSKLDRIDNWMERNLQTLGRHPYWVLTFLAALLVLYLTWMFIVPMYQAPDEEVRIILSDYVWRNGALPNAWDPAVRIHNWGFSYALRPMLVNIIGALFMGITSLFTTGPWALVLAVRLVSVFSGVILALYVFKIGFALEWQERWVWALALLVSLMPQISFLASYNNNDIFSLMCVAMVLYYWIRGAKDGWRWADCALLGFSLGLTCLSYYNAYPYVLFSVVFYFATSCHKNMSREEKKQMWLKAGLITLIAFALAGWWFIRNIILYDGDVLGSKTRLEMGELYAYEGLKPSQVWKPYREGISIPEMIFGTIRLTESWIVLVFKSMVGVFGFMSLQMGEEWYVYMAYFWGIGLAGWALMWLVRACSKTYRQQHPLTNREGWFTFCNACCIVLVFALAVWYSWTDDYQPQGRYLIPLFLSLMLFIMQGWRWIIGTVFRQGKAGTWIQRILCLGICVAMVVYQGFALFGKVIPEYKGQPKMTELYQSQYWLHQE